ncbi:hypothetical protein HYH02_008091 [Chlamydomonas schloesseri]|uniref:Uncharacterized protein n=1 Tax=Chlamydomonas schloesseri TaxID=2026947 RepID=A0A835WGE2_9CHLO|nr:hypothetical protein HYH02_008091 [Chlamydomonas schloesseri]|eukprot:KAG2446936.1 hypothetical protein HYH02_008091 [Chlamydomonas schloesseri]
MDVIRRTSRCEHLVVPHGSKQESALHRCTSSPCVGVLLLLHDLEPPPPDTPGVHVLHYMPKGIIVHPCGPTLGAVCPAAAGGEVLVPPDCILVAAESHTFKVPYGDSRVRITHQGIPLVDGYGLTDYAMHVHLLSPLWKPGDTAGRLDVMQHFLFLGKRDPALAAELDRLAQCAEAQADKAAAEIDAGKQLAAQLLLPATAIDAGTTTAANATPVAPQPAQPAPQHTAAAPLATQQVPAAAPNTTAAAAGQSPTAREGAPGAAAGT